MTAIELLAACLLAALLMVAVLRVVGSFSAQQRALLADRQDQPWQTELARQLRWDLANARHMRWRRNELTLVGYGSQDFVSGIPTHRPAEIVYCVKRLGQRTWFLRQETHLESRSNHNSRTTLVCEGVASLEVHPLDEQATTDLHDGPVPDKLRLVLYNEAENQPPVVDKVMFFR